MKRIVRGISITLASLLLLSTTVFASEFSSPRSSLYISGSDAEITAKSNGNLTISFWISGTDIMSEVGATSIDLYEDNGYSTRLIKTYRASSPEYSHLMGANKVVHRSDVDYSGTVGYKYYAKVHLTARNSSGSDSIVEVSPSVTAKR